MVASFNKGCDEMSNRIEIDVTTASMLMFYSKLHIFQFT
jgi:hypothetical protein